MCNNNWSYVYSKIMENDSLSVCWSTTKHSYNSSDLVKRKSLSNSSISNLWYIFYKIIIYMYVYILKQKHLFVVRKLNDFIVKNIVL